MDTGSAIVLSQHCPVAYARRGNRRAEGRILCPTEVPAERRLVGRGSGNHGRCDGTTSGTGDGRRFYRVLGG